MAQMEEWGQAKRADLRLWQIGSGSA